MARSSLTYIPFFSVNFFFQPIYTRQLKWDTFYENKFNWISIWYILNKIKCKQSIIQFQWKCLHNIVYSEYRLQKIFNIQMSKFIKSRSSFISPSYTPMIKFSSTSTVFFSKMLLKIVLTHLRHV
jgi:hypothetical protein